MSENVIDLTQASSPLGDIPPEKDSNLMLLKSTILATPLHRLRGVLAEVCERLPEAAVLVKNALIVQREPPKIIREEPARINTPMTRIPRSSEDGSDESDQESETEELEEESEIEDTESEDSSFEDPWSAAVAINGKKMRSRYAIYILEVDWDNDTWADHDEGCHGPIDTPENKRDFPQGFQWVCCEEPGTAEGCKKTRHSERRPVEAMTFKQARYT